MVKACDNCDEEDVKIAVANLNFTKPSRRTSYHQEYHAHELQICACPPNYATYWWQPPWQSADVSRTAYLGVQYGKLHQAICLFGLLVLL